MIMIMMIIIMVLQRLYAPFSILAIVGHRVHRNDIITFFRRERTNTPSGRAVSAKTSTRRFLFSLSSSTVSILRFAIAGHRDDITFFQREIKRAVERRTLPVDPPLSRLFLSRDNNAIVRFFLHFLILSCGYAHLVSIL